MKFNQLLQALEVNAEEILERFSGNEALLRRFIGKFPQEPTYAELKTAFLGGQQVQTENAVHTLKGIAANLGFKTLQAHCSVFLGDLRGAQAYLPDEFARIACEYGRLSDLITGYFAGVENQ